MSIDEHVPPVVLRIHNTLTRYAKFILVGWALAMFIGGFFASYFINKAEDRLSAPFHSRAGKIFAQFRRRGKTVETLSETNKPCSLKHDSEGAA
jgi:hypothetical protein